jgi:hypothetical protein
MKYVKMLGLLAIAAAALMAFAGSASATTLTSPTGTTYTGKITAESHNGPTTLHGSFVSVSCQKSHVEGQVEKHGPGVTVSGKIATLSFAECSDEVTVLKPGSLEIHAVNCNSKTKYCTGTLTSTGAEIKIHTSVGECIFTTSGTHLGTVTGTDHTGHHATLDIDSAAIPRTGGSFFCGASGEWTGSYTVTTPTNLWINA